MVGPFTQINGGTIVGSRLVNVQIDTSTLTGGLVDKVAVTTSTITGGTAVGVTDLPIVIWKASTPVSGGNDGNENTLATINIPANTIGPNGRVVVYTSWTVNNNANSKTARYRFSGTSGTAIMQKNLPSGVSANVVGFMANRNAANSQVGGELSGAIGVVSGNTLSTAAIDTTSASTIVITAQKSTGTDTMTLESGFAHVMYAP